MAAYYTASEEFESPFDGDATRPYPKGREPIEPLLVLVFAAPLVLHVSFPAEP